MSLEFAHKIMSLYMRECGKVPSKISLPKSNFFKLVMDVKSCVRETSDDYTNFKLYGSPMPSQINPDHIIINSTFGSAEFYPETTDIKERDK